MSGSGFGNTKGSINSNAKKAPTPDVGKYLNTLKGAAARKVAKGAMHNAFDKPKSTHVGTQSGKHSTHVGTTPPNVGHYIHDIKDKGAKLLVKGAKDRLQGRGVDYEPKPSTKKTGMKHSGTLEAVAKRRSLAKVSGKESGLSKKSDGRISVDKGDGLIVTAKKAGIPLATLLKKNNLNMKSIIHPNQKLKV
jgi:LysM repeat protein